MAGDRQNIHTKSNPWALLPMGVFIVLYFVTLMLIRNVPAIGAQITEVPIILIFLVSLVVAMIQDRSLKFTEKAKIMGKGIGNNSIVTMLLIFVLAGIFTGTVGLSAASSVAYFLLEIFPPQFAVCVIFGVSCIVSLAMGTSVGAITILVPIGCTVATLTGHNMALCVASVIGGSMFGDNLSVISDTAIACTTGQGCKIQDKFKANFLIVFPAAVITLIIIGCMTYNQGSAEQIHQSYNLVEFVPYILVIVLGICGVNVFIVLGCGIVSGILIEMIFNQASFISLIASMTNGALEMSELIIVTIVVAAMSSLIRANGGFAAILKLVKDKCKNQYSAQFSIGVMVGVMDILVANNTVAIVVANPIAKEIGKIYHIKRRRIASILDTCSCVVQGLLPYGAQMLIAIQIADTNGISITAEQIIPFCIYQFVLFYTLIAAILIGRFTKGHVKTDNNYDEVYN